MSGAQRCWFIVSVLAGPACSLSKRRKCEFGRKPRPAGVLLLRGTVYDGAEGETLRRP